MYRIFEELLQKHGVSTYRVSKETGIAQSVFSSWKNGISTPKQDKMQKIADYFNVSLEYLMTGEEKKGGEKYYLNDETAKIAQDIFENKNCTCSLILHTMQSQRICRQYIICY